MFDKKLSLVDKKLSRVEKGFEAARASSNEQLLALNIRQGFSGYLLRALYNCKEHGFSDDTFKDVSEFYIQHVKSIEPSENIDIPSDRVNIIQFISRSDKLEVHNNFQVPDRILDYLLGEALFGIDVGESWAIELEKLAANKDQALCYETYNNYWKLLNSQSDHAENIEKANALFDKRKTDSYFQGADQTEGGGRRQ
ncbi:hypothetical protein [Enterovibrio norvegicus]|uniref:hypothetical protein n=1 Tax=Enterovibrio norvegicus TaxID=188144 RepID=UPI0010BF4E1F|nr:hypothetical protein [Enterovibrio norvegicus]TKF32531.1 hypothetical protein FCV83_13505 [Enterovibrio norvegicus]